MTTQIVNLTQRSVNRKIEETLKQNSEGADSQHFANPDLQHKLIAYVLKRINNCYVAVEPGSETTLETMVNCELQCHQLDCLIRQGMDVLQQVPADRLQPPRHTALDANYFEKEPSHWFG
ncbi:MAG: hypothetical protein F6K42_22000 [Leptolyngbya sp. SIO1D8]|nr:hypothetical protein [Leptolyngbya sp. SIO1D8]